MPMQRRSERRQLEGKKERKKRVQVRDVWEMMITGSEAKRSSRSNREGEEVKKRRAEREKRVQEIVKLAK